MSTEPEPPKRQPRFLRTSREIWNTLDSKEKKYLRVGFWYILFFGLISTFLLPWILTFKLWSFWDYTTTGPIGDTIGGISAPFIGILSAILTFLAFYVQYKANKLQTEQFTKELEKQKKDDAEREKSWQIERFENKFYELLRLHKDNVKEIKIANVINTLNTSGRNAFISMFYEFKYTYYLCKWRQEELFKYNEIDILYTDSELIRLAYIFFYCGVEDESDIMTRTMNNHSKLQFNGRLFGDILWYLSSLKQEKLKWEKFKDADEVEVTYDKIDYKLWNGQQSNLGHYYRHLFQTVKFVVNQDGELLTMEQKKDYLRSLRAQLSDFEQIMLYYNALADFGQDWISEGYFTTYRMIHNIPIPLANFGIRPQDRFITELALDSTLFEWLEPKFQGI